MSTRAIKLSGKLADVVAEINRLYGETKGLEIDAQRQSYAINFGAWRKSLPAAIRIGELLCRVKDKPGWHGKWLNWLKGNVPFDARTAQRYMKCYKRRDELAEFLKRTDAGLTGALIKNDNLALNVVFGGLADAYLQLTAPKTEPNKREPAEFNISSNETGPAPATDAKETDFHDRATEPEQTHQRRHKSQKQIMKELERMNEAEQEVEKQANGQLVVIVEKLSRKVKAAWPEFPDRLTAHGRALSELAERLKLNTAQN